LLFFAINPGLWCATPSALESIREAEIAGLHLQHPWYNPNEYAHNVTRVPQSGGVREFPPSFATAQNYDEPVAGGN
jgi:hypothetical protein